MEKILIKCDVCGKEFKIAECMHDETKQHNNCGGHFRFIKVIGKSLLYK